MDYNNLISLAEQKRAYQTFTNEALIDMIISKNEEIKKLHDKILTLTPPDSTFSLEESYRYNTLCARATLYPDKTLEEVLEIIDTNWKKYYKNLR